MRFQKGHKMSPEMRFKISQKLKGIKKSPETIAKMSLAQKINASKFTKEHRAKQAKTITGRRASLETRMKMIKSRSGKKNWNWKGGITPLYLQIRHHFKMRQWISDCFHRDDFTCQQCHQKGGKLNCHHIKYFSEIIEYYGIETPEEALDCAELWDLNNGVTLCKECHTLIHKKNG